MSKLIARIPLLMITALLALLPAVAVHAQQWPTRPIKFVISFGPGTASDAIARIISQDLTASLGQPVVVVHKPGADGTISGVEVQRATPDGYTFLFGTNSALVVAPLLRKAPPYNVLTDFTPVAMIGVNTLYFVVNPDLPIKSMADLVAYSRANPGKVNAATGHTYAIVSTGMFIKDNDLKIEMIPYKSDPEGIADLLAGRIHFMVSTPSSVYGHIKANKLRPLAGGSDLRNPLLPDVPTLAEAGQQRHPFAAFFALVGPAGLSKDIAERMNKVIGTALGKAEVRELLKNQGVIARPMSVAETADYIKSQNVIWKASLAGTSLQPQ